MQPLSTCEAGVVGYSSGTRPGPSVVATPPSETGLPIGAIALIAAVA